MQFLRSFIHIVQFSLLRQLTFYIFLPPGPAINQIIMPTKGNNRTQRIHNIFSVPDAGLCIILITANISSTRTSKPRMEYILFPFV